MSSLLTGGALVAAGLTPNTADFCAAATLLAVLVGATRLLMGALNGGALVAFMPHSVLEGFTLGAVWLVFASQLPVILGAAPPAGMHFLAAAAWLLARPALWSLGTLATALCTVVCLVGGKRLHPLFPGAIVASVLGCVASAAGLPVGPVVGAVRAGLPHLIDPSALPWHLLPALLPASVAIAVACFAESAAIGRRFAEDDGESWSCNRELISQGVCNLVVAAFGGFPVAGSLSRSSLARTAGGTTQLAHVVTGLTVLAFLPLGATLLSALPRAVLGGLVAVAVAPLLKPAGSLLVKRAVRRQAATAWPLRDLALGWGTAAATMAASPRLELGLQAGLGLAATLAAWQLAGRRLQDLRAAAAASAAL
jgi:SulP family sulfate permease